MPTSSTAAVCGFNQRSVEEQPTSSPLTPTRPEERPAISVMSDPGYSIGRFLGSSTSQQHARPPLSLTATSPTTTDDAEKAGRDRMAGVLAEIGFPASD
ncbi:hypothetical protein GQ607_007606 [Colletotrichum asianum]|uniref:Uncharacterized protein n=1 Tax=Colletotrichum asianum TaxID=702518 RepID=A0A8H3WE15_9PEZI|nr:hypothetical protein GQ607_007606 [Colletotrichum asianum]